MLARSAHKLLTPKLFTLLKWQSVTNRALGTYISGCQLPLARKRGSLRKLHTSVNTKTANYDKTKVCIIGSGNWGSAIAKIVGNNCTALPFCEDKVNMWVHEEIVTDQTNGTRAKLSNIINQRHENVKYLPDISLPENVVAVPDLAEASRGANLLIFVVPHQFLPPILPEIKANIPDHARGVSLIKGLGTSKNIVRANRLSITTTSQFSIMTPRDRVRRCHAHTCTNIPCHRDKHGRRL